MLQKLIFLSLFSFAISAEVSHYQHVKAEVRENGAPVTVSGGGEEQHTVQTATVVGPTTTHTVFKGLRDLLDEMENQFSNFKVPSFSFSSDHYPASVSSVHPKYSTFGQSSSSQGIMPMPGQKSFSQIMMPSASQKCDRIAGADSLKFECGVADFKPEEVHVKLNGETLKLSGYHEQKIDGGVRKISFEESVLVPAVDYNLDEIKSFIDQNNVLNVVVPKKKTAKGEGVREIAVQRS
ncbi:unnamed protein product [Bursaphelenchus okinawaensis]|uniref:SHSP domain-containing protein n=1 Tax=Bursaphelenchus okinawaensis TaxID=465554 RepID=A0A811L832_9BILA|nr:unnamed protein product [Bursaphelenchus okinawaensis]CAG9118483.1 unnamed protein product [Bursaphelenchus okinawaensis]